MQRAAENGWCQGLACPGGPFCAPEESKGLEFPERASGQALFEALLLPRSISGTLVSKEYLYAFIQIDLIQTYGFNIVFSLK